MLALDDIDRRLLSEFQKDFPLDPRPYAVLADRLGIAEDDLLDRIGALNESGAISRVGAVVRPHAAGCSTLAAMAVPPERLDEVAQLVSSIPEVNHNYQRDHRLNLWFVVAAGDSLRVAALLAEIRSATGLEVIDLPLLEHFHIDLGFDLRWT